MKSRLEETQLRQFTRLASYCPGTISKAGLILWSRYHETSGSIWDSCPARRPITRAKDDKRDVNTTAPSKTDLEGVPGQALENLHARDRVGHVNRQDSLHAVQAGDNFARLHGKPVISPPTAYPDCDGAKAAAL